MAIDVTNPVDIEDAADVYEASQEQRRLESEVCAAGQARSGRGHDPGRRAGTTRPGECPRGVGSAPARDRPAGDAGHRQAQEKTKAQMDCQS